MGEPQPLPPGVTTPPESDQPPSNPIEQSVQLAAEGKNLEAFTQWFKIPRDERETSIKRTLAWANEQRASMSDIHRGYLLNIHGLHREKVAIPEEQKFIIRNLPLLYSLNGETLFADPIAIDITHGDIFDFRYPGGQTFIRRRKATSISPSTQPNNNGVSFTELWFSLRPAKLLMDTEDFSRPEEIIRDRLTEEEATTFLKKLEPYVTSYVKSSDETHDEKEINWIIGSKLGQFLHPIKHVNLINDPELGKYLEDVVIPEHGESFEKDYLANFIRQQSFPSTKYFEKIFASKEYATENFRFTIPEDPVWKNSGGELPASAVYFTLLRQLPVLEKHADTLGLSPQEARLMKDRLTSYLFSQPFMKHVIPYFEVDEEYVDDLYRVGVSQLDRIKQDNEEYIRRSNFVRDLSIERTGDEARADKAKRFGEVIQAADRFLRETGDTPRAEELREREVAGVKFADFLPAAA